MVQNGVPMEPGEAACPVRTTGLVDMRPDRRGHGVLVALNARRRATPAHEAMAAVRREGVEPTRSFGQRGAWRPRPRRFPKEPPSPSSCPRPRCWWRWASRWATVGSWSTRGPGSARSPRSPPWWAWPAWRCCRPSRSNRSSPGPPRSNRSNPGLSCRSPWSPKNPSYHPPSIPQARRPSRCWPWSPSPSRNRPPNPNLRPRLHRRPHRRRSTVALPQPNCEGVRIVPRVAP